MTAAATSHVTLTMRGATNADIPFLRDVYASTRESELAQVDWTDEQKGAFVDHQFHAQLTDYTGRYPDARLYVVLVDGEPAGRLFLADLPGGREVRVLDVALLPAHRGRGLGTELLRHVLRQAAATGSVVSLHVERWNAARRLYERLGFTVVDDRDEVHLRMEARPVVGETGESEGVS
jgi:ribosomal protein S18 acetylase RimI-like enzyme